jgi:uncharacterized membrane protein YuzA (DUF378 family)
MGVIFLGQIPNVVQICGLCTGLIGVFVIIMQKKDAEKEKEIEIVEKEKDKNTME